jgi:hypothetical protein
MRVYVNTFYLSVSIENTLLLQNDLHPAVVASDLVCTLPMVNVFRHVCKLSLVCGS